MCRFQQTIAATVLTPSAQAANVTNDTLSANSTGFIEILDSSESERDPASDVIPILAALMSFVALLIIGACAAIFVMSNIKRHSYA